LHLAWLLVLAGSIVSGALLERWYAKLRQPKPDPSSQLKL
jgi:tryptophan-rich sensory protein